MRYLFLLLIAIAQLAFSRVNAEDGDSAYISHWMDEWYIVRFAQKDILAHASENEAQSNEVILTKTESELAKHFDKGSFLRHRIIVVYEQTNKPAYTLVVFRQTDASTKSMQQVYKMLKCVVFPDGTILLPRKPTKEDRAYVPDKGAHVPAFHVPPPEE